MAPMMPMGLGGKRLRLSLNMLFPELCDPNAVAKNVGGLIRWANGHVELEGLLETAHCCAPPRNAAGLLSALERARSEELPAPFALRSWTPGWRQTAQREAVCHPEFLEDLQHWIATHRRTARRLLELLRAVLRDPFQGIGKPKPLKYLGPGVWSRRITQEHRCVDLVKADRVELWTANVRPSSMPTAWSSGMASAP